MVTLYLILVYFYVCPSLLLPKIRVRIGEWDFSSTSEKDAHVERKVKEKIVHHKYNFFTYEYDLALLKLEKRVDFQDNIIPICLPGNDDLLIGKGNQSLKCNLVQLGVGILGVEAFRRKESGYP